MGNASAELRYDPFYGLVLPEHRWVPAPRYLLRRERILSWLRELPGRGELLEVGCGSGAMVEDYRRLGYRCTAVETSPAAFEVARAVHAEHSEVSVLSAFPEPAAERFDVLVSCEVLEHIEDDEAALRRWVGALKRGAHVLLSVPANPLQLGPSDEWAGHYRRYTRRTLRRLVEGAGLTPVRLESYGYPVMQLTEGVLNWRQARRLRQAARAAQEAESRQAATDRSGVERGLESRLFPLVDCAAGRQLFRLLYWLQERAAARQDGPGLLCWARVSQ